MKIAIIFIVVVVGVSIAAYLGNRQKQKRIENEKNKD
jgi:hypothetical protein